MSGFRAFTVGIVAHLLGDVECGLLDLLYQRIITLGVETLDNAGDTHRSATFRERTTKNDRQTGSYLVR